MQQRSDGGDVVGIQGNVSDLEVLGHVPRRGRARERDASDLLHVPVEYLLLGPTMLSGNRSYRRTGRLMSITIKEVMTLPVYNLRVGRESPERLEPDTVESAELMDLAVVVSLGVESILKVRGLDCGRLIQSLEEAQIVGVADTNRSDLALPHKLLKDPPYSHSVRIGILRECTP